MPIGEAIPEEQKFYEKENNEMKNNLLNALSNLIKTTNDELINIINEEDKVLKDIVISKINEIIDMVPINLSKNIIKLEKLIQIINKDDFHLININSYSINKDENNVNFSTNNFLKKYILSLVNEINKDVPIKTSGGKKTKIKNKNKTSKHKTNKNKTNKNKTSKNKTSKHKIKK
jgi:hypothetical protein